MSIYQHNCDGNIRQPSTKIHNNKVLKLFWILPKWFHRDLVTYCLLYCTFCAVLCKLWRHPVYTALPISAIIKDCLRSFSKFVEKERELDSRLFELFSSRLEPMRLLQSVTPIFLFSWTNFLTLINWTLKHISSNI